MRSVQKDVILNNIHNFEIPNKTKIGGESERKGGIGRLVGLIEIGGMKVIPKYSSKNYFQFFGL